MLLDAKEEIAGDSHKDWTVFVLFILFQATLT